MTCAAPAGAMIFLLCAGCSHHATQMSDFQSRTERNLAAQQQELLALKQQLTQNEFRTAQLKADIEALTLQLGTGAVPGTQPTTTPADSTTLPARVPAP
ncbi:MAG TPA: hypothetical protein PLD59_04680 [Tepidisphaeraceae bacterium]|nr:hypothetical protein [Tepidisphaeraceae bacterium]